MGFERADGQNGGPRFVQASSLSLSLCANAVLPDQECQRAGPLSPLRGVSVWGGKGLAKQSVEHQ